MLTNPVIAYCDYIAHVIKEAINKDAGQPGSYLVGAGSIKFDVSVNGDYQSTKKSISVADCNGKLYEVIVREV